LRAGYALKQGSFPVRHYARGWTILKAIEQLEGLAQLKNKIILSGLGPETFQLVAQCLSQVRLLLKLNNNNNRRQKRGNGGMERGENGLKKEWNKQNKQTNSVVLSSRGNYTD
jgi:hypothetical protein